MLASHGYLEDGEDIFQLGRHEVAAALDELVRVAKTDENIMPATIDAVRARATGGEIIKALRPVFGTYVEKPIF